ncbi:MAG: zinc-binding dehydrogenase [Sneathiellaceae bacterium]
MTAESPVTNLAILSLVKEGGELDLSLARLPMPEPKAHEVLVEVKATPINPSDLFLLLGGADIASGRTEARDGLPAVVAPIPQAAMRAMAARVGTAMPVGNEGAGTVVKAGAAPEAQALLGKTVAMLGGAMYAQYRCLPAKMCMEMPDGTDPRDAASCFVNPLTALGFVETARREGHRAIVHTAAASNLGQMLNRICMADGIPLVSIVRKPAQADLLKAQGARHVVDSSAPDYMDALTAAIAETGATLAFDAIGGGKQGGQILGAMEAVAARQMKEYNRYGSDTFKQLYVYGALDLSPTVLNRTFGFKWSMSGWLLPHFLADAGPETAERMRARVVAELTTTFASRYSHEISLEQALDPQTIAAYEAKRTGEKYLIRP